MARGRSKRRPTATWSCVTSAPTTIPDHDSICAFRVANKPAIEAAFVTVLQLAHHLRLTQVGTISINGIKIQANASKHAAVSYQWAGEMLEQLELEVKELLTRAAQAEAQETKAPLDIPAELAQGEKQRDGLKQARQVIEQRAQELAAASPIRVRLSHVNRLNSK